MLPPKENELITRVGPGTPMGDLLRRYWYPIAAQSEMDDRWTQRIRLLGEDFVPATVICGQTLPCRSGPTRPLGDTAPPLCGPWWSGRTAGSTETPGTDAEADGRHQRDR